MKLGIDLEEGGKETVKSELEIIEEIASIIQELAEFNGAYHKREITFDKMSNKSMELHAKLDALRWVLGKSE